MDFMVPVFNFCCLLNMVGWLSDFVPVGAVYTRVICWRKATVFSFCIATARPEIKE